MFDGQQLRQALHVTAFRYEYTLAGFSMGSHVPPKANTYLGALYNHAYCNLLYNGR